MAADCRPITSCCKRYLWRQEKRCTWKWPAVRLHQPSGTLMLLLCWRLLTPAGLATASKCGLYPTASGSGASGCNTCHNLAACYAKPWTDTIFGTKKHRAAQVSLALSPKTFTNQKCRVKKSSFTLQAVAATRAQPPYCVLGSSSTSHTR